MIHNTFLEANLHQQSMTGAAGEVIIRVIEEEKVKKLCAIRIYTKPPDDRPRPVVEIPEKEQVYFVYDIVQRFANVAEAHDYAEKNNVINVEY